MDTEEIAKLVKNLKLSQDTNKAPVILSSDLASLGRQRLESCLIGKVFSSKAVNRETFRTNMPRILQAKKQVAVEMVGENLFSLDFKSINDKQRALQDGPWNFFKDLVLFAEPKGLQNPNDIEFTEVPLWIQLHNLPLAFMQPSILRNLGEKLGKVLEVEAENRDIYSGKFARVCILKKLADPLDKGIWVKLEDSQEESCILILYERLPNFCYACGRVGHVVRDCEENMVDKSSLKFEGWLRAPAASMGRRPGHLRNRNSETREPSEQGGDAESPFQSNTENISPSIENLLLNSEERDQDMIREEDGGAVFVPNQSLSTALIIKDNIESMEAGGLVIADDVIHKGESAGSSEINLMNKGKAKIISNEGMNLGMTPKSNKKWKRLARGDLSTFPDNATGIIIKEEGKRIREQAEIARVPAKKVKNIYEETNANESNLAVAAQQSRQSL